MTCLFCLGLGKRDYSASQRVNRGRWEPRTPQLSTVPTGRSRHPSPLAEMPESSASFGLEGGSQRWACCSERALGLVPCCWEHWLLFICYFRSPGWGWAKQRWENRAGRTAARGHEHHLFCSPVLRSLVLPLAHPAKPVISL